MWSECTLLAATDANSELILLLEAADINFSPWPHFSQQNSEMV